MPIVPPPFSLCPLLQHFASQGYRLTVKKPAEDSGFGGTPAGGDEEEASDDDLPPLLVPGGTGGGGSEVERDIEH